MLHRFAVWMASNLLAAHAHGNCSENTNAFSFHFFLSQNLFLVLMFYLRDKHCLPFDRIYDKNTQTLEFSTGCWLLLCIAFVPFLATRTLGWCCDFGAAPNIWLIEQHCVRLFVLLSPRRRTTHLHVRKVRNWYVRFMVDDERWA